MSFFFFLMNLFYRVQIELAVLKGGFSFVESVPLLPCMPSEVI